MSTTSWQPSTTYQKVAEANRQYYAQTAAMYEATETCVTDPLLQRGLESDLDRALATLGKPLASVRALDACGGSGNVALKLLRRGVGVTLVDISPDLQEIFRAKCVEAGFVPKVVCSELAAFLAVEGSPTTSSPCRPRCTTWRTSTRCCVWRSRAWPRVGCS
jgi:SAM-dependent methyltransferase